MTLTLYYHPLASFCHKVLIALYENETPFEGKIVDLSDPASSAEMLSYWPVGKFPVLHDKARNQTTPETTIIIEYLSQHYSGRTALIPTDQAQALDARLWDRFFDLYVHVPMQKIVLDRIRPEDKRDPLGVAQARDSLKLAYDVAEQKLEGRTWATGAAFTIADCAASPALFYAGVLEPFASTHPNLAAYFERLLARPSFARVLVEARPYFKSFPFYDLLPGRFLHE